MMLLRPQRTFDLYRRYGTRLRNTRAISTAVVGAVRGSVPTVRAILGTRARAARRSPRPATWPSSQNQLYGSALTIVTVCSARRIGFLKSSVARQTFKVLGL